MLYNSVLTTFECIVIPSINFTNDTKIEFYVCMCVSIYIFTHYIQLFSVFLLQK